MEGDAGRLVKPRPPTHCHLPRVCGKSRKSGSLKRTWRRPEKGKPAHCKNATSGSQPLPPPTRAPAQKHIELIMARSRLSIVASGCSHCRAIGEQERRELFTCRSCRGRQDVHTKKCPLTAGNRGELRLGASRRELLRWPEVPPAQEFLRFQWRGKGHSGNDATSCAKKIAQYRAWTVQEFREIWSGRRDLNPRPQPWQGCALPLSYTRSNPPVRGSWLNRGPPSGDGRYIAQSILECNREMTKTRKFLS